ncbi:MAG TPA: hypothetical protein VFU80_00955 [Sphingomicrobium sp.]|nr:hypothetical protein [Sphingomicrobium sp.]
MSKEQEKERSRAFAELEGELRRGRKFSAKEAMARLAGPGAMKGASPVSRVQQAEIEVGTWLRSNVADTTGALQFVLHRHVCGSELLLHNLDQPLAALAKFCEQALPSDYLLKEIVREADVEWGQRMGERPHFEREGSPDYPGDPYTLNSVRDALSKVVTQLADTTR